MGSSNSTRPGEIPYAARRLFERYEPAVRARVRQMLAQRISAQGEHSLTLDFVCQCISSAVHELSDARSGLPQPDPRMVDLSLAAFRRGEYQTTEELADEIRARMADAH